MPAALSGSLEKWLARQVDARAEFFTRRSLIVDVGAYHGDFAASMLKPAGERSVFDRAMLFEPNPDNIEILEQRYGTDRRIEIIGAACDEEPGTRSLHVAGPSYTGSLLDYAYTGGESVAASTVACVTLDGVLSEREWLQDVGLLKIDTQGNDLQVLRGAEQLLANGRPWIVVELIYVDLYDDQARPADIEQFLAQAGYVCANRMNEHYTADNWLGWCDACFVPAELVRCIEPFQVRPTVDSLAAESRGTRRRGLKRWFRGRGAGH